MRFARQTAVVVVLAAVPHLLLAQRASVPSQDPTTFVNANVVDVRDGKVLPNATIIVRDGKIVSVGTGAATAGTVVIDVGGRYMVPGLFDAHAHIMNLRAARRALEWGVTTVRSGGVSWFVDIGLRELVKKGAVAGPDVLAAGYHVTPQLAEEAFLGDPGLSPFLNSGITTEDAIRHVVRAHLARGVDWIKTHATERGGLPETDPRRQLYTADQLKMMVEEAAAKGIPVMAHAHGEEGARAAVQAGARSIEHGTYLSDETLRLMAQKGTFLVPTHVVVVDLTQPGGEIDHPDLLLRGKHMLPRLRETIEKAIRLNVKIAAGTDSLYSPNSVTRVSQEIAAFVDMGMTPLQALQSATTVAAEMCGMSARTGAIAPGLEADLLVVERNPLQHIGTLDDALLVMSNGRIVINRLIFGSDKQGMEGTARNPQP